MRFTALPALHIPHFLIYFRFSKSLPHTVPPAFHLLSPSVLDPFDLYVFGPPGSGYVTIICRDRDTDPFINKQNNFEKPCDFSLTWYLAVNVPEICNKL